MRFPLFHRLSAGLLVFTFSVVPILGLSGCRPPEPRVADSGVKIIKVNPQPRPPYQTVEKDGVEYRLSRFPVGRSGGTFYDSSIGRGPKTFNPLAASDATSSQLSGMMFVGLTDTDPYTGETTPLLAKSLEIKPDRLTYVIRLRKGLTWSDGHPLTADDVVFTWNRIIKPGLGNPSNRDVVMINGRLPEVRKLDDLTVEFKTPEPFAPFKGNLGTSILPKHVVEPVIRNNTRAFDSFWGVNTNPKQFVVNGPFILKEYIGGQRAVFKRNPKFFAIDEAGNRLPYLSQYVVEFVQDQNAEVLQFEQGHIDTLGVPGSQVFYVKHLGKQPNPDFKMYDLGPTSGTSFLMFNMNPRRNRETGKPYVNPKKLRWFRDLNFRKAVDYAIQREQIVQNILMGVGAPLFTAESLSSVFLNEELAKGHPADLNKAREYLKKSGFYWNSRNQLFDKDGNRVEFEMNTNTGNLEREAVGVSIKEDLAQLGMKVNFRPIDFNVLISKMDAAEWECMIMGLTGNPIEPHSGKNVWESTGALHIFNQRNPQRDMPGNSAPEPWEREIDRLFNQGSATFDMNKRREIYNRFQQVVSDNLPFIYLYSPKAIVAVRNRVKNFDPTPLGTFHNLEAIWVEPKK